MVTTGVGSELEGYILAGAEITLDAASKVTGGLFATDTITVPEECYISTANVLYSDVGTVILG